MGSTSSNEWRYGLPKINEKARDTNKLRIYACYRNKSKDVCFYVGQGSLKGGSWVYWGLAVLPGYNFPFQVEVSCNDLESGNWSGGVPCEVDAEFLPDKWSEIKSTHFSKG